MSSTYDSSCPKSRANRQHFKQLLEIAWQLSARPLPVELAPIITKQFEIIGYEVGIKGLNRFLSEMPGEKTLSAGLIAQLGGKPFPKPLDDTDKAKVLANKVYSSISRNGIYHTAEIAREIGLEGWKLIDRCGGLRSLSESQTALKQLTKEAEIFLKQKSIEESDYDEKKYVTGGNPELPPCP